MNEITSLGWAALACAALLIGFSKTGFPGAGILAIPLAAMVIDPKQSTGVILPMLILGDVFAVAYWRRHAVWKHLVKLLPFACAGVVIGWRAMALVSSKQLGPIIGAIVLAMLILNYLLGRDKDRLEREIPTGWWFPAAMGLLAGVTTMMANAAGPIMIVYLLAMRLPKGAFIGTGAWYFLLINCFKVPFSADLSLITPQSLTINLVLAPVLVLGAMVGIRLVKRVPEKTFGQIVQLLALAGAIKLIF